MAKLWDNPRPEGYWPNTPSQWREPTVDDCTWYATEFAFQAASENHYNMHPVKGLRSKSTDTEGGTPIEVALRDSLAIWPKKERVAYDYGAFPRWHLERALKNGAVLVLGGDYERLPLHYRRWTYNDNFDHAVAVKTFDVKNDGTERTFMYDPLGGGPQREPYDGEWISLDNLFRFVWKTSGGRIWAGIVENRGEPALKSLNLPADYTADKVVRLKKGTTARMEPRITANEERRFWNENNEWPFLGRVAGGWRVVLWKDESDAWEFGYVENDDILEVKKVETPPIGVTPPETSTPEEVAALERRIEELETTLSLISNTADEALAEEGELLF